jgi:hypothetical protein
MLFWSQKFVTTSFDHKHLWWHHSITKFVMTSFRSQKLAMPSFRSQKICDDIISITNICDDIIRSQKLVMISFDHKICDDNISITKLQTRTSRCELPLRSQQPSIELFRMSVLMTVFGRTGSGLGSSSNGPWFGARPSSQNFCCIYLVKVPILVE